MRVMYRFDNEMSEITVHDQDLAKALARALDASEEFTQVMLYTDAPTVVKF